VITGFGDGLGSGRRYLGVRYDTRVSTTFGMQVGVLVGAAWGSLFEGAPVDNFDAPIAIDKSDATLLAPTNLVFVPQTLTTDKTSSAKGDNEFCSTTPVPNCTGCTSYRSCTRVDLATGKISCWNEVRGQRLECPGCSTTCVQANSKTIHDLCCPK
jgi:hypothetical protein